MSISRLTAAPTRGCETPLHAGHSHLGNSSACDLVNATQERCVCTLDIGCSRQLQHLEYASSERPDTRSLLFRSDPYHHVE
ncbi:hypothetical protein GJ496_003264 [Pomphorhynchus laevis]|nr:hypothetical protein GJ496_003264 [Pomphorhynchus laevis]